jgi:hypothetical protein
MGLTGEAAPSAVSDFWQRERINDLMDGGDNKKWPSRKLIKVGRNFFAVRLPHRFLRPLP